MLNKSIFSIICIIKGRFCIYLSSPMMKALTLMQWVVSWAHCLILETRLWRTLVDGPVAVLDI